MKSLKWPNNNAYINITLHPHISIWHVQPGASESHLLLTLWAHTQQYPGSLAGLHIHIVQMFNTDANMWDVLIGPLSNLWNFFAQWSIPGTFGPADVTPWPHLVPSCDTVSSSVLTWPISTLVIPDQQTFTWQLPVSVVCVYKIRKRDNNY